VRAQDLDERVDDRSRRGRRRGERDDPFARVCLGDESAEQLEVRAARHAAEASKNEQDDDGKRDEQ
jgi:hypothetical protein